MADVVGTTDILQAISDVQEPALNKSLVSAMLVRDVEVKKGKASLTLVLLTPAHPKQEKMQSEIRERIEQLEGIKKVEINTVVEIPADGRLAALAPIKIKSVIAVASGKGGVGKSTIAVNIAVALAESGAKVGLMDADVYGPNIPTMMGIGGQKIQPNQGQRMTPIEAYGVKIISIGLMVPADQPVVWRGPMLHAAVRQFIHDVDWGEIDYLVIDLPPGTGDTERSLAQTISVTGGLIVTLPQQLSLEDARRGLEMFRQLEVPILGIVENMSHFICGSCGEKTFIFSEGGGKSEAKRLNLPFLGGIPLVPSIREGADEGKPVVISEPDSPEAEAFNGIALKLDEVLSKEGTTQKPSINF